MNSNDLRNVRWNDFVISEVFDEVRSSKSQIDKIKLKNLVGNIPYITRTQKNNGIDSFVGEQPNYEKDPGNSITIGLDTQTIFYQTASFYTGQNIQVINDKNLNKNIALFLIPLLKKQLEKFNWGGNGVTLTRLRRTKIKLPINKKDNVNWSFMEKYIKKIEKQKNPFSGYTIHEITDKRELSDLNWKEFFLNKVFTINSGKRLTKRNMIDGNIPFIGASDSNNGITNFVGNKNKSLDSNLLGVNYNGSVVENFYHPYKCLFSDDVKRLKTRNVKGNKYIYLFLKTIILQQKSKYRYSYKFNARRMKRQIIILPVDNNDKPDWGFMEQYMKRIENEIISKKNKLN